MYVLRVANECKRKLQETTRYLVHTVIPTILRKANDDNILSTNINYQRKNFETIIQSKHM